MNKSIINYELGIMNFLIETRLHFPLSFFLLFALFFSCSTPKKQEEKIEQKKETADVVTLTKEQIKNANLVIGSFDQTTLSEDVKANGIVDVPPMNMASVSVPINGFVKSTKGLPGLFVRKGEVLAVLNSMDYEIGRAHV